MAQIQKRRDWLGDIAYYAVLALGLAVVVYGFVKIAVDETFKAQHEPIAVCNTVVNGYHQNAEIRINKKGEGVFFVGVTRYEIAAPLLDSLLSWPGKGVEVNHGRVKIVEALPSILCGEE